MYKLELRSRLGRLHENSLQSEGGMFLFVYFCVHMTMCFLCNA